MAKVKGFRESVPVKRVRSRTGYVMVELTKQERAMLEQLCARLTEKTGLRFNLAATLRHLIRTAKQFGAVS